MAEGDSLACHEQGVEQIWETLNRFRANGQLCDAVLITGGKKYPVHRAILAANSPYFRAMFTNGMLETEQQEIEIANVDCRTMTTILDYIYTRSARLSKDTVENILTHADGFLITGLVEQCCNYMVETINPTNCFCVLKFAQNYYRSDLATKVKKYILNNFSKIARQSRDFLSVNAEDLVDIISADELNARSEEEVYEAVLRWIDYKASTRTQYLPSFLRQIRLGLIQPDYFADRISCHPYVKNNEECVFITAKAWDFLYNLERRGNRDIDLNNPLVRPRVPREVLFAIGGWSGGTPISFFESYDTRADRWYTHSSLADSTARAYHGLAALGGMLYVIGGFDGHNYFNSVRRFNPLKKEWKEVAPMYRQRCYISVAVANGFIYVCGGYDGRWRLTNVEKYDPESNQWSNVSSMHYRRSDAGADTINGKIYIAGGFDGELCLRTAEEYDPITNQWTLIPQMMSVRSGVGIVAYQGYIFAIGGFDGERRLCTGECYDPISKEWTIIPEMYAPRSNFAIAVLDQMIFVIGGFNGSFTIPHVECYDGDSREWYDATDMNINRSALKACVIKDFKTIRDFTHYGYKAESKGRHPI